MFVCEWDMCKIFVTWSLGDKKIEKYTKNSPFFQIFKIWFSKKEQQLRVK